ncbi:unnamed protein product [Soboliphyme baturini]|uniref:Homeobox domain-containing protein n=1 Tax=Soboliphyme baturini TaxID=241478 RepID=A0A183IVD5_9BILA|nr:unnamed protein product [Soboliphyme baturini]
MYDTDITSQEYHNHEDNASMCVPSATCGLLPLEIVHQSERETMEKGLRSQRQCNGQNATAVQAKRFRTVFTMPQLTVLEAVFQKKQYMVGEERCRLAKCLGLSDTQIKVWFQNRRIKWRKEERESGLALLNNYSGVHYVRL